MSYLTNKEKEIVRLSYAEYLPMTINEFADRIGMSWVTAKKYLDCLVQKGVIIKQKKKYQFNKELAPRLKNIEIHGEKQNSKAITVWECHDCHKEVYSYHSSIPTECEHCGCQYLRWLRRERYVGTANNEDT